MTLAARLRHAPAVESGERSWPPLFYGPWVAACTAGELVGIGTATGTAMALHAWLREPTSAGERLAVLAIFAVVALTPLLLGILGTAAGYAKVRSVSESIFD